MGGVHKRLTMKQNDYFQVAAFQGKIIEKSPEVSLEKIVGIMALAEKRQIDILCSPESYLHGYLNSKEEATKFSIDLQDSAFEKLCDNFKNFLTTTLLLGLNERDGDEIFNTVVVIEQGRYMGRYRKAYTYAPYDYFSLGRDFPVFEKRGIKYGIIICLDSAYREPAHITALNGAKILFCPSFNRVSKDSEMLPKLKRKGHFISRAYDNHCWLVCSDIIWEDDHQTCAGHSCILNDDGEIVATAEPFLESLITYSIPMERLQEKKYARLLGTPELFHIMKDSYQKAITNNRRK